MSKNQNTAKGGAGFWILLAVAAMALNMYNLKAKKDLQEEVVGLRQQPRVEAGSIGADLFKASRLLSLSHAGRFLKFPDSLAVEGQPRYRVLLAISEKSCGSCRDSETRFITQLADRIGEDNVQIIVHAESSRYIASYKSANGVNLPVDQDQSGAFFKDNGIMETPMTFLVNERNEVIAAHFPTPNRPDMSEPFREMLNQFFDVAGEHKPR